MSFDLNETLRKERIRKEGILGKETRAKIAQKLAEAERLENQRGLGAREALAAVNAADKLRAEGAALEKWMKSPEFEYMAEGRNRAADMETLQIFSNMQSDLIEQSAAHNAEIDRLFEESASKHFLMGSDPRDLKRQIGRLIEGEGEIDPKYEDAKFVRFQLPESAATYRCIQLATGQVGFVVESQSNGQGE